MFENMRVELAVMMRLFFQYEKQGRFEKLESFTKYIIQPKNLQKIDHYLQTFNDWLSEICAAINESNKMSKA